MTNERIRKNVELLTKAMNNWADDLETMAPSDTMGDFLFSGDIESELNLTEEQKEKIADAFNMIEKVLREK